MKLMWLFFVAIFSYSLFGMEQPLQQVGDEKKIFFRCAEKPDWLEQSDKAFFEHQKRRAVQQQAMQAACDAAIEQDIWACGVCWMLHYIPFNQNSMWVCVQCGGCNMSLSSLLEGDSLPKFDEPKQSSIYKYQRRVMDSWYARNYYLTKKLLYEARNTWLNAGDELNGNTLIHHIAFNNMTYFLENVRRWNNELDLGIDFNVCNKRGQTPLDVAYRSRAGKVVKKLLYLSGGKCAVFQKRQCINNLKNHD